MEGDIWKGIYTERHMEGDTHGRKYTQKYTPIWKRVHGGGLNMEVDRGGHTERDI